MRAKGWLRRSLREATTAANALPAWALRLDAAMKKSRPPASPRAGGPNQETKA